MAVQEQAVGWICPTGSGLLTSVSGDTDDKNPLKNVDVTSAAGSNLSAIRQTGYFVKIFVYYAQRAKICYWNCLGELPAGSRDALVDKEVEKEGTYSVDGWQNVTPIWHQALLWSQGLYNSKTT